MVWSLLRRKETPARAPRVRPCVDTLEGRETPAVMSAYETYALQIINQLRANPAAFAADLKMLYLGGTYQSPTGMRANDPVWADLRAEINAAEAGTFWRSGFTAPGLNTFMGFASSLPSKPPLAWDSALHDGAVAHNQWMYTNFYTHSVFTQGQAPPPGESPSAPIPGIARNFRVAAGDWFNWTGMGLNRAGENISYAYDVLQNTLSAYKTGKISLAGYYQRIVYADLVGYVLEYSNTSGDQWGHLENLVAYQSDPSFTFSLVGPNLRLYENPVESEKGTPQSYFSTYRFGSRPNQSFVNVLAYQDLNNNNFYDPGEGLSVQLGYSSNLVNGKRVSGTLTTGLTGYTRIGLGAPYSTYTISAAYSGYALGSQTVTRDGNNQSVVFRFVPQQVLTGLRDAVLSFATDGSWWALDGRIGYPRKVAQWTPQATAGWKWIHTADVNGDGRSDLIGNSKGAWYVSLQGTTSFEAPTRWAAWANIAWTDLRFGDLDGDDKTDFIGRNPTTGQWSAGISTGTSFTISTWGTWAKVPWVDVRLGDLDGDGRDDLVGRNATTGEWTAGLSTGTALQNTPWGTWTPRTGWVDVQLGDLDGDGKADLVGRQAATGKWYAGLSTGSGQTFAVYGTWAAGAGVWGNVRLADLNGDGKMDLVGQHLATGRVFASLSTGTGLTTSLWGTLTTGTPWGYQVGDLDGDGKADLAARNGMTWYAKTSTGTAFTNRYLGTLSITYLFSRLGKVEGTVFTS